MIRLHPNAGDRPGAASPHGAAEPTDGELLGRFAKVRDRAALELLVRRHGPMVLGVCRRLLGPGPDADDAFQATFLVLVRKGATLRRPGLVANWLYGVALRVARKARALGRRGGDFGGRLPAGGGPQVGVVGGARPHGRAADARLRCDGRGRREHVDRPALLPHGRPEIGRAHRIVSAVTGSLTSISGP